MVKLVSQSKNCVQMRVMCECVFEYLSLSLVIVVIFTSRVQQVHRKWLIRNYLKLFKNWANISSCHRSKINIRIHITRWRWNATACLQVKRCITDIINIVHKKHFIYSNENSFGSILEKPSQMEYISGIFMGC